MLIREKHTFVFLFSAAISLNISMFFKQRPNTFPTAVITKKVSIKKKE